MVESTKMKILMVLMVTMRIGLHVNPDFEIIDSFFFIIFYLNVLSEVYEEEEQADQAPPTPCSMSGLSVAGDPNAKETTVNPLNEDDACFEEENGKKSSELYYL